MDWATDHRRNGHLPDYYRILGVSEEASFNEIESAYWKAARSPDRRNDLPLLNEAYEVLGNEEQREVYDAQRYIDGVRMKKLGRENPNGDSPGPRSRPWR